MPNDCDTKEGRRSLNGFSGCKERHENGKAHRSMAAPGERSRVPPNDGRDILDSASYGVDPVGESTGNFDVPESPDPIETHLSVGSIGKSPCARHLTEMILYRSFYQNPRAIWCRFILKPSPCRAEIRPRKLLFSKPGPLSSRAMPNER